MANRFERSDITETFLNIIAVIGNVPSCAANVPRNNAITALNDLTEYFSGLSSLYHLMLFTQLFNTG